MSDKPLLFWIATNGPTCARSEFPMRRPIVSPVPEQMWGFPTSKEAKRAQEICLHAPIEQAIKYLAGLGPDIRRGRITYFRPERPEPPVPGGVTMWLDEPHEQVQ
jgi:hypothetical protein